jgi:ribonuclease M5
MNKLKIPYPVIVEGKYDRLRLISVIEAQIITTEGFGIFKKNEKAALVRALAANSRIIVLTDSDGAGKVIRSHISQLVPSGRLIQLYIPKIEGKERRKAVPSAEGTLGVEGMETGLLRKLFEPYSDPAAVAALAENPLSKTDFYIDGLSGGAGSAAKRDALASALGLPEGMSANALLSALRMICPYEKYLELVGRRNDGSKKI